MLFGYPTSATAFNWLHETLNSLIVSIHENIDTGKAYSWPESIPDAYRDLLSSRTGLRDRLEAYRKTLERLSKVNRDRVLSALTEQNEIRHLLDCSASCEKIYQLPKQIQKKINELFDFSFKLLTPLKIRDEQYKTIYFANERHICPFCGFEYFDAPGAPREDLDHYLAKTIYPFAATNLINLVPMGKKCNQAHKSDADILFDANGIRRKVFYPYSAIEIKISLLFSEPFGGEGGRLPNWMISFVPDSPESKTWDSIFHIKERYRRDILDPFYLKWLRAFSAWFKQSVNLDAPSEYQVIESIQSYIENLQVQELDGRDFLREPVFQMLHQECTNGNQRLLKFMQELVTPIP